MKNTNYTYEMKQLLKEEIEAVKEKEYLLKIYHICNNDNINITKNKKNTFLFIENLSNEACEKIKKILSLYDKSLKPKAVFSCNDIIISEEARNKNKKKYTNAEKSIIKTQEYRKAIKEYTEN